MRKARLRVRALRESLSSSLFFSLIAVATSTVTNSGCEKKQVTASTKAPSTPSVEPQDSAPREEAMEAGLLVTLTLSEDRSLLQVKLQAVGPAEQLQHWILPSALDTAPSVSSAEGEPIPELESAPSTERQSMELRLSPITIGELNLEYTIPFSALSVEHPPARGIILRGSEIFAYPSQWKKHSFEFRAELRLERKQTPLDFASSLESSPASRQVQGTSDITAWTALVGPIQRSQFKDHPGREDSFAVLGAFLFDSRWFSAEIASIRSAVDNYFASPHASKHQLFLYAANQATHRSPISLETTNQGLLMSLRPDASWDSPKRIALTQFLIRRRLVGLWDYFARGSGDWAKVAFEQGCARQIARSLLFAQGMLSAQEYADDLNSLEAAMLDPFRPSDARRAQAIASGASMCRKLDLALRTRTKDPSELKYWISDMRIRRSKSTQPLALTAGSTELGDASSAKLWQAVMLQGQPSELGPAENSPCLKSSKDRYAFYDLGAVDPVTNKALGPLSTFATKELGLRADDLFVQWTLDDPLEPTKVKMEVTRQGSPKSFEFAPKVVRQRGTRFKRVGRVPDSQCQL